jgi:hypothetical protein
MMGRDNCTLISTLIALSMVIAAPAIGQAQDPFQSAPGPAPARSAIPHTNAPRPHPPAAEQELSPSKPPPAAAIPAPPNLDRIKELAASKNIPLPQDLQIKRPGPDIPAAMARFSGVWGGDNKWNGKCRQVLIIVEAIERPGQATIVEAEGPAGSFCYGKNHSPWFQRAYANIQGDSVSFTNSKGFSRKFTLVGDNQLYGVVAAKPDANPPFNGAVILISRLN